MDRSDRLAWVLVAALLCALCAFVLSLGSGARAQEGEAEKTRYLRPSGKGRVTECTFTIRRTAQGWSISGVTERGKSPLTVAARYDAADLLLDAEAVLGSGEGRKTARVTVSSGKAKVEAAGREAQEFEVPKGTIVTSAPDWTDTFLLCRLRDRAKAGVQEFPGLWIHPEQPTQRLTFTVEKLGDATLDHEGKKLELERLSIRLRGNSRYVAWADGKGRMVKLVSMPFKEGGTDLVLEGFEASAAALTP